MERRVRHGHSDVDRPPLIFRECALPGVFSIEAEPAHDPRGSFARIFCPDEFERAGIEVGWLQESVSTSTRAGTLRGLHYQAAPHTESKIVTCVAGAVYDVVVDLRPGLHYGRWLSFTLEAGTWQSIYIPKGCAHGFQTLADATSLLYRIDQAYVALAARGIRYDDPQLRIPWPLEVAAISERDAALPGLTGVDLTP